MDTSTPRSSYSEPETQVLFQSTHSSEIQAILETLVKITNLSVEVVKPHLDTMLLQLEKSKLERPFYETATPDEWVKAFREWADSHKQDTPILSDYAVSRAGIYEEDEEI
jgi:hypothetical protein